MLTTPLKKLSQATAVASLGVAMMAAVATAPASAVQLKTFNLSGTFASQPEPNSTGLVVNLAGASFDGTYTVDVDQLSVSDSSPLFTEWNVNLRDSSNNILSTLSNQLSGSGAGIVDFGLYEMMIFGDSSVTFLLTFNPGFLGTGTANNIANNDYVGIFADAQGRIGVTSATSTPVPEPMTMGGIALGSAMGWWMKRQQKAAKSA